MIRRDRYSCRKRARQMLSLMLAAALLFASSGMQTLAAEAQGVLAADELTDEDGMGAQEIPMTAESIEEDAEVQEVLMSDGPTDEDGVGVQEIRVMEEPADVQENASSDMEDMPDPGPGGGTDVQDQASADTVTEDSGERPEDPGYQAEDTGQQPEDSGQQPEDTGQQPEDSGQQPGDTGQQPDDHDPGPRPEKPGYQAEDGSGTDGEMQISAGSDDSPGGGQAALVQTEPEAESGSGVHIPEAPDLLPGEVSGDLDSSGDLSSGNTDASGFDAPIDSDVSDPGAAVSTDVPALEDEALGDLQAALMEIAEEAGGDSLQGQINDGVSDDGRAEIRLTEDYTENIVIPDGTTVVIDMDGHSISPDPGRRPGGGTLNTVTVYGTLVLTNGRLTGVRGEDVRGVAVAGGADFRMESVTISGFDVDHNGGGNGGGVLVEDHGSFRMEGGAISGNRAAGCGGGIFAYSIYRKENSKTLEIKGGAIRDNAAGEGGGIAVCRIEAAVEFALDSGTELSGNTAKRSGGGFYLAFAADRFTVASGPIRENTAGISGGGICLAGGASGFVIAEGAEISGNTAGERGGGICLDAGTALTMEGGCVDGNCLTGGGANIRRGGGIYLAGNRSSFTMTGGRISGNHTEETGAAFSLYGGGVYVGDNSEVHLSGGRIEGNYSFTCGGGIYIANGSSAFLEDGMCIQDNRLRAVTDGAGAGLWIGNSALTMTGGTISGNRSEGVNAVSGGGISVSGTMTMSGGEIRENTVSGNGGGISGGMLVMTAGLISGNHADGNGGGVSGSRVQMSGGIVTQNTAGVSGGGVNAASELSGDAEISHNVCKIGNGGGVSGRMTLTEHAELRFNTAGGCGGGQYGSPVTMTGGTVADNEAGTYGGGLCGENAQDFEISGGVIARNSGNNGGGIAWWSGVTYALKIGGDAELSDNTARNNGGGVWTQGPFTMAGGSIHGNSGVCGGGVYNEGRPGTVSLEQGSLYDNTAGQAKGGHDLYQAGTREPDRQERTVLKLQAPSNFTHPKYGSARAWFEEKTEERLEDGRTESMEKDSPRAYTLLYEIPEETPVAMIDADHVYVSVQAAVDALTDSRSADSPEGNTITMLADSTENVIIPGFGMSSGEETGEHPEAGTGEEPLRIVLDLDGHTLRGLNSSVILVRENADLTIQDSSALRGEGTGKITGGSGRLNENRQDNTQSHGGGLYVLGSVTLRGGHVTGNTAELGAGVYIGQRGTFTLEDGGFVDGNRGHGVCVNYLENSGECASSFFMKGGSVSRNTGTGIEMWHRDSVLRISGGLISENAGRGICMQGSGTVEMTGGSVRENTVNGDGAGIYLAGGSFTFDGGSITGNVAGANGGGIRAGGTSIVIGQSPGGVITGNRAGSGGGIYFTGNARLTVYGGQIFANEVNERAKDLYVEARRQPEYQIDLMAAGDMGLEEYDSWYSEEEGRYYEGRLTDSTRDLYLAAARKPDREEAVRIGSGVTASYYETIAEAAAEVRKRAGSASAEELTIYLCRDHSESVTIINGDDIVIDLNGHTLSTDKGQIFYMNGGALTLLDGSDAAERSDDTGPEGVLTPREGNRSARAVYMNAGTLTVKGVLIRGFGDAAYETAGGFPQHNGGAVCGRSNCTIRIGEGTVFSDNHAYLGGAIYMKTSANDAPIGFHMKGAAVSGNGACEGGGIYLKNDHVINSGADVGLQCEIEIADSTFSGNTAQNGGGAMYLYGYNSAAGNPGRVNIVLDHAKILENRSAKNEGGIYLYGARSVKITGSEISGNYAESNYGGFNCTVSQGMGDTIAVADTKITGNIAGTANYGGGRFSGDIEIKGSEVKDNRAEKYGAAYGGIYLSGSSGITDTEISGNYAYYGGALGADGPRFVMGDGVRIHDNTAKDRGNVYFNTVGECELNGGEICGNTGRGVCLHSVGDMKLTLDGVQIRGNTGYGIGIWYSGVRDDTGRASVTIKGDTIIEDNLDSGVYCDTYVWLYLEGGVIRNNRTAGNGGGIFMRYGGFRMTGGTVCGNTASLNGGGIWIARTGRYKDANANDLEKGFEDTVSGGTICGNTASNGGGIFVSDHWTEMKIDGGEIRDNEALNRGGGIYVDRTGNRLTLSGTGVLCDNAAKLGQDVYAYFDYGRKEDSRGLDLTAAGDMFRTQEDGRRGIGWLDEEYGNVHSGRINSAGLTRSYALTLQYRTEDISALVQAQDGHWEEFSAVQDAVDAAAGSAGNADDGSAEEDAAVYGDNPTVLLVRDSTGSVRVPGGAEMTLNLNGYTLRGSTTALEVYGKLRVVDEPHEEIVIGDADPAGDRGAVRTYHANLGDSGEVHGRITGSSPESGGGIVVHSGGAVKMESGQISGCRAAGTKSGTDYGGAGVCVDGGSFELAGGQICGNRSGYGSAVYVKGGASEFRMTGGEITANTSENGGAILVKGGSFRMTGGKISGNTAEHGAALRLESGNVYLTGGSIEDNTAANAGGALCQYGGTLRIAGTVRISGNRTTNSRNTDPGRGAGGAVYLHQGVLWISGDAEITGNRASARGGAVYQHTGTIRMTGGRITGNTAALGGGIAQNPGQTGRFMMTGGGLYDNAADAGTGNDFYSRYEGTGNYGPEYGSYYPRANLPAAARMGNTAYNAWKDDSYEGTVRVHEEILKGQYVTGEIVQSWNLQLTASRYGERDDPNLFSTMYVQSMNWDTEAEAGSNGTGVMDGTPSWDAQAMAMETYTDEEGQMVSGTGADAWTAVDESGHRLAGGPRGTYAAQNWSAGDDSSDCNGIIRTYDRLTYSIVTTVQDQKSVEAGGQESTAETGNAADAPDSAGTSGGQKVRIYLEVRLPANEEEAEFDPGLLEHMDGYEISEYTFRRGEEERHDGQILTGWYEETIEPGGAATIKRSVVITVKAMKNGERLQPEFRQWVGGNRQDESNPKTLVSPAITVSALGKYNLTLQNNRELSYTGYFDLDAGEEISKKEWENTKKDAGRHVVYGTMLGYGMTLSLCNDKTDNNLRGVQLPGGDITFDLRLGGALYLDGEPVIRDEAGDAVLQAPYIWAWKENVDTEWGTDDSGTNHRVNMDWNDEDDLNKTTRYAYNAAPFNTGGGDYGCSGGGVWDMQAFRSGGDSALAEMRFRVSGYTVEPADNGSPNGSSDKAANDSFSGGRRKPFSAGYVQVLFPIDEEKLPSKAGNLRVGVESMVSDLQICDSQGNLATGKNVTGVNDGDLDDMRRFFGPEGAYAKGGGADTDYTGHSTCEMLYADNYLNVLSELFAWGGRSDGSGDGTDIAKHNFFNNKDDRALSGNAGTAVTPVNSEVWIGADAIFSSTAIYTTDADRAGTDPTTGRTRYRSLEAEPDAGGFDSQKDNYVEYYYMTAMNLLQKFDADAYAPVGGPALTGAKKAEVDRTGIFHVTTTEGKTEWDPGGSVTLDYELTVLYAAKPDGGNWTKAERWESTERRDLTDANRGGEEDMAAHREENLLYFHTMDELHTYFGGGGKCVAILYQFRNCFLRRGRQFTVTGRMKVTDDFERTGMTFCTTNDVKCWTTYRPFFKETLSIGSGRLDPVTADDGEGGTYTHEDLLYRFRWDDCVYGTANGACAYGLGLPENTWMDVDTMAKINYDDHLTADGEVKKYAKQPSAAAYTASYRKTEYDRGNPLSSTHTGWNNGNTLLLCTLESRIQLSVADIIPGSTNTPKESYAVSRGERTAKFQVIPEIAEISGYKYENLTDGKSPLDVEITLQIPKHLHFDEGSVEWDYSDSPYRADDLKWDAETVTDDAAGITTVTLRTSVNSVVKKLPRIRYACTIGACGKEAGSEPWMDVSTGETLRTMVGIAVFYSGNGHIAAQPGTDTENIYVIRGATDNIWIEGGGRKELGEDLLYTLNFMNVAANTADIEIGDVLPYNGDGRGTQFGGGYGLYRIRLRFADRNAYDSFLGNPAGSGDSDRQGIPGVLKLLERQTVQGSEPEELNEKMDALKESASDVTLIPESRGLVGGEWVVEYTPERLLQEAGAKTGIALYGSFPGISADSALKIDLFLTPLDREKENLTLLRSGGGEQAGGNLYGDNFFYRSDGQQAALSMTAAYHVVERRITGSVWMDQDQDGWYSAENGSTDRQLQDIDVYLYTDTNPAEALSPALAAVEESSYTTVSAERSGYPKIRVAGKSGYPAAIAGERTSGPVLTIEGKTCYPAVDILGNPVEPAATGSDGRYSFGRLRAGNYYVFFDDLADSGALYRVTNGTKRLEFDRLSATRIPNVPEGLPVNRAVGDYAGATDNVKDGAAPLAGTWIENGGEGIRLPENMTAGSVYNSGNWNCGLYYIDLSLEKVWENIVGADTGIDAGTTVILDVTAGFGPDSEVTCRSAYRMTAEDEILPGAAAAGTVRLSVTQAEEPTEEPTQLPAKQVSGSVDYRIDTQSNVIPLPEKAEVTEDRDRHTITWSLRNRALQAEGAGGPITYTVAERAIDVQGRELTGYRMLVENAERDPAQEEWLVRAVNSRILFRIDLTKLAAGAALPDSDLQTQISGSQRDREADAVETDMDLQTRLSGAEFRLFRKDADGSEREIALLSTDQTGGLSFGDLAAGTYYLEETRAPAGYRMSKAQYRIEIACGSAETEPTVRVYQCRDEDGEAAAGGGLLLTQEADQKLRPGAFTVAPVEDGGDDRKASSYAIGLCLENKRVFVLPGLGGAGILWNIVAGAILMLAAVWLARRRSGLSKSIEERRMQ